MWPNPQFPADLVTFTDEILNGKLHFLRRVKILVKVPITVFVTITVQVQMKYGWIGIGFIQLKMLIVVLEEKLQGLHQTTLHDIYLPSLKALREGVGELSRSVRVYIYLVLTSLRGPSIKHVSKRFRKTNISNTMILTRTYVCVSGS